ncbi:MAG: hypothetical protein Q7S50_04480 [bacterium]|nr:hypothetical protein [bacterium]
MKTALLASYEKDAALLRLGRLLTKNSWKLLGSAGTAKYLNENNVACRDVAEIVGKPILGHRVVTLSRELHAGLLSTDADQAELDKLGVPRIDLVYVTLYPLGKAIDAGASQAEVIEKTDIGGPTLLRAAAKGRRVVLSNPAQIDILESWIKNGSPESEREALVTEFAAAAERRVADYVDASARYWESKIK